MSDTIAIYVKPITYKMVQRLAVLAGDENSAIERLIAYWELGHQEIGTTNSVSTNKVVVWKSSSGDEIPVGERLEGKYEGIVHFATIELGGIRYEGKLFDSPSAAARAVKQKHGREGASTSTDGRKFWKLRDPRTNRLIPIADLRPKEKIDVAALLAQIDRLPSRTSR